MRMHLENTWELPRVLRPQAAGSSRMLPRCMRTKRQVHVQLVGGTGAVCHSRQPNHSQACVVLADQDTSHSCSTVAATPHPRCALNAASRPSAVQSSA
jgi:hypothetical protein